MNNPAVPDERPPYWGKCKEMSFGELRKFIDDSLTALAKPGSGNDWPRSKEEFLELVDMLLKKVEELAGEVPPPPPETEYVSPPSVPYPTSPRSPWYEPPEQLAAAYDRHQELTERLRYALDEGSSRRYIEQLESDLRS